mmetsp:Transcript_40910/g.96279  ORF Transcript_40910/g.96279 Transcript_40910/m.96279 type:complete len:256 (-) Transcript_40910:1543-2310(-)
MGGSGGADATLRGVLLVEPPVERGLLTDVKAERGEPMDTSDRLVTSPRGEARASLPLDSTPADGRPATSLACPFPSAVRGRSTSLRSRRGMALCRITLERAGRAGTGRESCLPAAAAAMSAPKREVPFCLGDFAADFVGGRSSTSHDPVLRCVPRSVPGRGWAPAIESSDSLPAERMSMFSVQASLGCAIGEMPRTKTSAPPGLSGRAPRLLGRRREAGRELGVELGDLALAPSMDALCLPSENILTGSGPGACA